MGEPRLNRLMPVFDDYRDLGRGVNRAAGDEATFNRKGRKERKEKLILRENNGTEFRKTTLLEP